ncbi:uncharacterized protein nobox [Paramormyrops kingsleyae]|uniref:Uncharacterized LOC111839749 n=1 Tax=Paramormyrops kingsleyae TaxID=1676925 RepID=A0A3B3SFT5_9TELE|nr:uncharacterized protein LOC111839749 [Paramormyrops kingsleyae]
MEENESMSDFDGTSLLCKEEEELEEVEDVEHCCHGNPEEESGENLVVVVVEEEEHEEEEREAEDGRAEHRDEEATGAGEEPSPVPPATHEDLGALMRGEPEAPVGMTTVCEQADAELLLSCSSPPEHTGGLLCAGGLPISPRGPQGSHPLKRSYEDGSPTLQVQAPLLSELDPDTLKVPKVASLDELQPLQVNFTQVYPTRHYTRYAARGRGAFLQYPAVPVVGTVGEAAEPVMPPGPKKKTRTLYTTDQLEELERLFQDDHYPDSDKRKEIAAVVGVTPQRIMVWFQNRRAKWRKAEKTSTKLERRQPVGGRAKSAAAPLHVPVPPARPSMHVTQAMTRLVPQPVQTLPHYSSILSSCLSPSGEPPGGDAGPQSVVSTGLVGGTVEYMPPLMVSPPPLRRASLPLLPSYPPPSHLAPLLLDTPDSGSAPPHPDGSSKEVLGFIQQNDGAGTSSSLFSYGDGIGSSMKVDAQHYLHTGHQGGALSYQLTSYPQQHSGLLPTSNLAQYPRMSYLVPPSSSLTPTPPESNPSYLAFAGGGSGAVVSYTSAGHAFFQAQSSSQILLPSGVHAYQACPWGEVYNQPNQYPATVFHRSQYTGLGHESSLYQPNTGPGLLPAQHYVPLQRSAAVLGPGLLLHPQKAPAAPSGGFQTPTSSVLRPQYQNPDKMEEADSTAARVGQDADPGTGKVEYEPTPESGTTQLSDSRPVGSDTGFDCDFSPIHF